MIGKAVPYNEPPSARTTPQTEAKIRIRNLTKEFKTKDRAFIAVDNISLDISPGTFFTIVGPSGCGKTTLLRIVANLETPTSGSVEIAQSDKNKPGNSMIFQGESIFPWMTVWDNAA